MDTGTFQKTVGCSLSTHSVFEEFGVWLCTCYIGGAVVPLFIEYRSRNMIEKQVFFLDIIGRGEAFSKHRFQVSSWLSLFHY